MGTDEEQVMITLEEAGVSPTVHRIFSVLRERILTGDYKPGEWLPAERTLAEEFNVSRNLIRAAISELQRQDLVQCATHRRPMVRPTVVGHSPTGARNIAVWIWPGTDWQGSALMIQGVQESLDERFRLILGSAIGHKDEGIPASEARFLKRLCQDRDISGLIISFMGGATNRPYLETLRANGVPLVFVDHNPPSDFNADFVGVNNKRSAEIVVRHLISQGHTHIAHVTNHATFSTVAERLAGYKLALERARIPFLPELVECDPGPGNNESNRGCEELVTRLLSLPEPPTAIFAVHDIIAYRVMTALQARGLRVPEDMSLVGFDGIERWMPTAPFLTTVYQPFDEIGALAVELLTERVENGPNAPYRHILIDAPFVIHQSTQNLAFDTRKAITRNGA